MLPWLRRLAGSGGDRAELVMSSLAESWVESLLGGERVCQVGPQATRSEPGWAEESRSSEIVKGA